MGVPQRKKLSRRVRLLRKRKCASHQYVVSTSRPRDLFFKAATSFIEEPIIHEVVKAVIFEINYEKALGYVPSVLIGVYRNNQMGGGSALAP